MGKPTIKVLLVEDSEEDATWIQLVLRKSENVDFRVDRVDWLSNATTAMSNRNYDIVLLDLGLPDSRGIETLTTFLKVAGTTPVIVLTGHDEMELAMQCMEEGAQDFQLKSDVRTRPMERSILYAIKRRRNDLIGKRLMRASLSQFSTDGVGSERAPEIAMLREHLHKIPEAIDEVRGYLRRNAPHVAEDIEAILDVHHIGMVLKEMRDVLAKDEEKTERPPRPVRDVAHDAISAIRRDTPMPETAERNQGRSSAREELLQAMEELKAPIGE